MSYESIGAKKHKTLILTKRWEHHSRSGGYDRLANYLTADAITARNTNHNHQLLHALPRSLFYRLLRSRNAPYCYSYADWVAECIALAKGRAREVTLCHALYAEEQLQLLLKYRHWFPPILLGSFHVPPSDLCAFETRYRESLRAIDSAVCVSRCQVEVVKELIGNSSVTFIPHGVDTSIFVPSETRKPTAYLTFLTVGQHRRDFSLIYEVAKRCESEKLAVRFKFVGSQTHPPLRELSNTEFLSQVSEFELVELNQEADAAFLPLNESTANNALLEAIACGTPALVTEIGGVEDYVSSQCAEFLVDGDSDYAFELVRRASRDRSNLLEKRKAARDHALALSWEGIAAHTERFYDAIIHNLPLPVWRNQVLELGK